MKIENCKIVFGMIFLAINHLHAIEKKQSNIEKNNCITGKNLDLKKAEEITFTFIYINQKSTCMINKEEIEKVSNEIVSKFFPDKIILFGSQAYGKPSSNSDVDLLVILPFLGKNFNKSLEIYQGINVNFPIDILARTPEDTEKRFRLGDPLIRDALNKGKVLYERNY